MQIPVSHKVVQYMVLQELLHSEKIMNDDTQHLVLGNSGCGVQERLISFPDNYGDQTGLGTTDLKHFNMYSRETNFKKWILKKRLGSHDLYNPRPKNLPSMKI